ncbi:hypothetical protein HYFRA_00008102 [Hymenoscyphus fraxineus]|uniref:Rhodopsin domain-containing protein n=1 Tax=Hymenoscyphus fraxineus TaxID=746836 RepID=A0A9N9L4W6_9HELO|nr:hypothetical protein HYFRA_00008102 [Hymenoscyphus fraxineus]
MDDLRPTILALCISMPLAAIIAVALRVRARHVQKLKLERDDYTIFIALVLAIALAVDLAIGCQLGRFGAPLTYKHNGDPDPGSWFNIWGKASHQIHNTIFASQLLWYPCIGLTRISVLLFYSRVFKKRFDRIVTWMTIIIAVWMISFDAASFYAWAFRPYGENCTSDFILHVTGASCDILINVIVLAIPIRAVSKLPTFKTYRIAIIGTFLVGLLVVTGAVVGLVFAVGLLLEEDIIYYASIPLYLDIIEACVGIQKMQGSGGNHPACLVSITSDPTSQDFRNVGSSLARW